MWKIAIVCFSVTSALLVSSLEEPNASSPQAPYIGVSAMGPSTSKPPDVSSHRTVPASVASPVVFSPQPYIMNPKPQDLHPSSSVDYAYMYTGGNSGYEHYAPPVVYDHHTSHGSEHLYHAEENGHHSHYHEDRQVDVTGKDVALGFLTFLIILSTLQGATLNLMRNPNIVSIMPAGRRRREALQILPGEEIFENAAFSKVAEDNILAEDQHVKHAQHNICSAVRSIAGMFGLTGSSVSHYLSELVSRSEANGWPRLVTVAGTAGLTGTDCGTFY